MNTALAMRPMSIGDVLDTAFSLYRRQFRTLFTIAAIVQAPVIALTLVTSYFNAGFLSPDFGTDPAAFGALYALMGIGICAALIGAVGAIVQTSALTYAVSEQFHGRLTSIGRAYRETLRHASSLVVCSLLLYGAIFLLAMCWFCVVPLIALVPLAVRWMFAYQAIMLEDADGVEGMRSSWHLVRGQFWRTLGFAAVMAVMSSLINIGPTYLASVLGYLIPDTRAAYMVSTAVGSIISLILTPVFAASTTLYYYDLRMRQEGYDLQLLAHQLEQAAA